MNVTLFWIQFPKATFTMNPSEVSRGVTHGEQGDLLPASPEDASGNSFGRYRLVKRLAVGGMGEVYLARYVNAADVECVAVVKRILPKLSRNSNFIKYFRHEGRISSLLNHPNVVQTIELGQVDGQYFIAMEYIPGPSLVRLLATALDLGKTLSIPLVLHLSIQMARALDYVHTRHDLNGHPFNIIHMDLAPHNLLVTMDGQLKVLDFGIARAQGLRGEAVTRRFRGRTSYLAPEQLKSLPLDQRVDIFAMGVMIHEMVLGRPLFRARQEHQTANRILYAPIPSLTHKRGDCPEALDRAVQQALQRERDKRTPTARALMADLDGCLERHNIVISRTRIREELTHLIRMATGEDSSPGECLGGRALHRPVGKSTGVQH